MRFIWNALALACAPLLAVGQDGPAGAQFLVVPSRVVFEGTDRSAELTLSNRGVAATGFEVAYQHFEMDEGGRLHETHPSNAGMLESLVKVTPSRTTLQPGESQVFRILLHPASGLPPGEYRVHLTFRARPMTDAPAVGEGASTPLTVTVQTLPGISVPVIYRNGTQGASVAIRALTPRQGKVPGLTFRLEREGDESVFGDVSLQQLDAQGAWRVVASHPGLAVYPSLAHRIVEIPFTESPPPGARYRVVFTGRDQDTRAEAECSWPR